jgi:hypothetical protein
LKLLNTITGNCLTFFYPVAGEATSQVDGLKKVFKTEKAPRFDDVAANELILWRVSILVVPANKHKPIVLNEVESPTELDPTDDVSDVFPFAPPKKTIHVIVQRPPSGNANALCSHSYLAHELVLMF